ncbi:MAG: cytochrome P450 [Ilumatobacter sp.]|jgi:cytochrome P450|uniref:cytochrome P450 n=1 Tax=Ilumatobacter sp. TaxID=1967498 RepID=UPI0039193324
MTDTTTSPVDIPSFFDPAVQDDPFEAYELMREHCPVHRLPENGLYMVTRYDDVKSVLSDRERFSSNPVGAGFRPSEASRAAAATMAEKGWKRAQTLQRTDPPVHTHYRRLLGRVFTIKRVNELVPRIEQLCHELIDGFVERGKCEFVRDFALPLPGIVICEQLGLDAADYPRFKRWADAMLASAQRVLTVEEAIEQAEIELEAQHHLAREFERRREAPTDDLISALVHAHGTDEEPLTMEELQDLMHQLITGGFETTTAALGTGLWLLLRHPDQMAKLRANPDLMNNFIDESLRIDSPVAGLWRRATCPVEVAGVEIPTDAAVMVRYAAANRDHAKFDDPNTFDIERDNASEHIAFGWGNHLCVGAWLARAELRCAFTAILARLDDLALTQPLDEIAHEFSFMLRPLKELPISFTAASTTSTTDEVPQ